MPSKKNMSIARVIIKKIFLALTGYPVRSNILNSNYIAPHVEQSPPSLFYKITRSLHTYVQRGCVFTSSITILYSSLTKSRIFLLTLILDVRIRHLTFLNKSRKYDLIIFDEKIDGTFVQAMGLYIEAGGAEVLLKGKRSPERIIPEIQIRYEEDYSRKTFR